ncbi:hypothetical protein L227DRAFT_504273 [Lentinus tigrinus ALCF2SS1-6]|uniref:Uncharacterized protein n=2 Tax=Lentinus tigrinus TaxID=5365 RepID=A0A5C2SCE8_9APHY|nr:hypothetical protein L227DRAFT_504273 [Lentinus tigrinus ALCF2SS1-6]
MGRPLYSASRQPAVRVEPEPQHPAIQKWTYWNAFDPDADEFFENDDAVYEAFINPADRIQITADRTIPTVVEVDVSSPSEWSSSGRGTPMGSINVEIPENEREQQLLNQREMLRASGMRILDDSVPRNPVLDAQIEAGRGLPSDERVQYYMSLVDRMETVRAERESRPAAEVRPVVRERVTTYLEFPQEDSRTPSPEPVPVPVPRSLPSMPATPARPSTPPAQVTPLFASPSPPPSVTPRLYSWASLSSAAPVPSSPLTNRGARMSVAHIMPPALISAHRVA